MTWFNGQLWAAVQMQPGKGGGSGRGQVWVCTNEGPPAVWVKAGGDLDSSVMVLEVMDGVLYAATSAGPGGQGRLYRWDAGA